MRHTTLFLLLLAALSNEGCTGDSPAGELTRDDAVVGGRDETGFEPVGYLSLERDRTGKNFDLFCTATLIAPRVVVTAAHCMQGTMAQVRPEGPWITFATGPVTAIDRVPTYMSEVYLDPQFHPEDPSYFSNGGYAHDLALVVLESPVTSVVPAQVVDARPGVEYLAVGYGRTTVGRQDLLQVGPPQRKSLPMAVSQEMSVPGATPSLVAISSEGSICYGDSGGPLVEVAPAEAKGMDGGTRIAGVLASFFVTSLEETCVPGSRAVYASLSAKRGLIDEVLARAR